MYIYIYIYIHVDVCIYIYIYRVVVGHGRSYMSIGLLIQPGPMKLFIIYSGHRSCYSYYAVAIHICMYIYIYV